jgi:hypothetical protein
MDEVGNKMDELNEIVDRYGSGDDCANRRRSHPCDTTARRNEPSAGGLPA